MWATRPFFALCICYGMHLCASFHRCRFPVCCVRQTDPRTLPQRIVKRIEQPGKHQATHACLRAHERASRDTRVTLTSHLPFFCLTTSLRSLVPRLTSSISTTTFVWHPMCRSGSTTLPLTGFPARLPWACPRESLFILACFVRHAASARASSPRVVPGDMTAWLL